MKMKNETRKIKHEKRKMKNDSKCFFTHYAQYGSASTTVDYSYHTVHHTVRYLPAQYDMAAAI